MCFLLSEIILYISICQINKSVRNLKLLQYCIITTKEHENLLTRKDTENRFIKTKCNCRLLKNNYS